MAQNINKTTKILLAVLAVVLIAAIISLLFITGVLGRNTGKAVQASDDSVINETVSESRTEESGLQTSEETLSAEEEYKIMMQDKNFISIYNNFAYPSSNVEDARYVEPDASMFYIVLETFDSFEEVDGFYKTKKVQSTWRRSEIFETGSENLEDVFLDNSSSDDLEDYYKYSKYSYLTEDKDKILNVLIKSFSEDSSQILIIYWKLSK